MKIVLARFKSAQSGHFEYTVHGIERMSTVLTAGYVRTGVFTVTHSIDTGTLFGIFSGSNVDIQHPACCIGGESDGDISHILVGAYDRIANLISSATNGGEAAVDDHLWREYRILVQAAGVLVLPFSILFGGKRIVPAKIIPVMHMERQGKNFGGFRQFPKQRIGWRAGRAAL